MIFMHEAEHTDIYSIAYTLSLHDALPELPRLGTEALKHSASSPQPVMVKRFSLSLSSASQELQRDWGEKSW